MENTRYFVEGPLTVDCDLVAAVELREPVSVAVIYLTTGESFFVDVAIGQAVQAYITRELTFFEWLASLFK